VVVRDLNLVRVAVSPFSKSRNSPFDGRTFRGGPVATIVDGLIAWRRE
jgi:dihydroorotase-like cyclic amidohydrolase